MPKFVIRTKSVVYREHVVEADEQWQAEDRFDEDPDAPDIVLYDIQEYEEEVIDVWPLTPNG